jgi:hypothetical protein
MVDVFVNGVKFVNGTDFTATDGTTVVMAAGLAAGNIVEIDNLLTAYLPTNALRTITTFTATAGQSAFSVSYTQGLIDVFYNGSCLAQSEYIAINGTSVTLVTACQVNDIVVVYAYSYSVGAYSGIGGSGTINTIPKFTASSTIGDSAITDNGTTVTLVSRALSGTSASFSGNGFFGGATTFSGLAGGIALNGSTNSGINFKVADVLKGYAYVTSSGNMVIESVSGSVILSPSGSPSLTITSAGAATFSSGISIGGATATTGGIQFPATEVASANANNLDDYEEGTWTPSLGGTTTYVAQVGAYTKIGRFVLATFEVNVSSIGTGSTISIGGLPFTSFSTPTNGMGGMVGYFTGGANSVVMITLRLDLGSTSISVASIASSSTGMNAGLAFFTSGTRILGSITYMTA